MTQTKANFDTLFGHLTLVESSETKVCAKGFWDILGELAEQLGFSNQEELFDPINQGIYQLWEGEYQGSPVIALVGAESGTWNFHLWSKGALVGSLDEIQDLKVDVGDLQNLLQGADKDKRQLEQKLSDARAETERAREEIERLKMLNKELDW